MPDLWKAECHTATFLKRDGDTFAFGHRSLFEYFLARYLHRVLADGVTDALAMPVPSPEVLDFLGQLIAGDGESALAGLARIGRQYTAQVSELAFAFALRAAERGRPHQSLAGVHLTGAQLAGYRIGSPDRDELLPLNGADLSRANLRQAVFHQVGLTDVDLTDADLTNAELHDSVVRSIRLNGARAAGTIVRRCILHGTDVLSAETYRMQILRCTPMLGPAAGLLIAPAADKGTTYLGALQPFTGHRGAALAVAWSPDGTHLATAGGDDGTVRMWNPTTGSQVGIRITGLPEREVAVFDATTDDLTGASDGAWRWLGYTVVQDGQLTRLPSETFGPLPPLTRS